MLDRAAKPAIAAHGGRVDVVDVVDGELRLRMSGGCQGCAASTATLRDGVERMVRAAVPEIARIVDVTDHDAGLTPYYSHADGRTASPLARAVLTCHPGSDPPRTWCQPPHPVLVLGLCGGVIAKRQSTPAQVVRIKWLNTGAIRRFSTLRWRGGKVFGVEGADHGELQCRGIDLRRAGRDGVRSEPPLASGSITLKERIFPIARTEDDALYTGYGSGTFGYDIAAPVAGTYQST